MRLAGVKAAILDTAKITGMIFLILIGAEFYSSFLALSQLPQALAEWVAGSGWPAYTVLAAIVLIYLVLGCLMDGLAMMLVTIPVFLPLILKLDFGMPHDAVAVWFGILVLILIEVGQITPPIGLNVYVINSMAKEVPMTETFRGVMPFFLSDLVRIAIIIFVPATTTWLAGLS
jgi:C4-dicarboxylate transporter DctM subunit